MATKITIAEYQEMYEIAVTLYGESHIEAELFKVFWDGLQVRLAEAGITNHEFFHGNYKWQLGEEK